MDAQVSFYRIKLKSLRAMERHSIFPVVISFYGGKWESLSRLEKSRDWIQTVLFETDIVDIQSLIKMFCRFFLAPFKLQDKTYLNNLTEHNHKIYKHKRRAAK